MEVDGEDDGKVDNEDGDAPPTTTDSLAEEDGDNGAEEQQPTAKPASTTKRSGPAKPLLAAAKKAPFIKTSQPKPLIAAAAKSAFGPKKGKPLLLPKATGKGPTSDDKAGDNDKKASKGKATTGGRPPLKRRRIGSADSDKTAVNSQEDVDMASPGDVPIVADEDDIVMPRSQSVSPTGTGKLTAVRQAVAVSWQGSWRSH